MSDAKPFEIAPAPLGADDLAARINAAHEEVKNSIRRGAEHAIKAGRLLLEAKANVGHGNFLKWIGANCNFRVRTAQLYMTMAEELPLLEAKSNAQRIAHLSLNEAVFDGSEYCKKFLGFRITSDLVLSNLSNLSNIKHRDRVET